MWPVWPESCAATARLTGRREAGDGGDDGDGGGDGGGDDGDGDGDGGGGEAAADGGVERTRDREIARVTSACHQRLSSPQETRLLRGAARVASSSVMRECWSDTESCSGCSSSRAAACPVGSSRRGLAAAPSTTAITRPSTARCNRFIFLTGSFTAFLCLNKLLRVLPFCLPGAQLSVAHRDAL